MLDAASQGQTKMPNIESVQRHLDTIDWADRGYMKVYFSALLGHVLEQLQA